MLGGHMARKVYLKVVDIVKAEARKRRPEPGGEDAALKVC